MVAAVVVPMRAADVAAAQLVVARTVAVAAVTVVAMVAVVISAVAHAPPIPASHARTQVTHRTAQHAADNLLAQHGPRVTPWVTHSPASTPAWKPKTATAASHAVTSTTSNLQVTPRRASRHLASQPATAATFVALEAEAVAMVAAEGVDAVATVVVAVVASAVQAATDPSPHSAKLLLF